MRQPVVIGGASLYLGDCTEILPLIEGVDSVITDPPYSEQVHGASRSSRMQSSNDRGGKYGADARRNVDLGFAHLNPDLRLLCSLEFARMAQRWVLVFSDVESDYLWRKDLESGGLDYVRTGAWLKLGATPQFSGDRPATGFEAVTICHPKGRKRWNGGGAHAVWSCPIVLDRGRTGARLHTTQKPVELMQTLVSLFSDAGEVVLDAFMGSATTGVAAIQTGRKFIGIERDERYFDISCKRIEQAVAQGQLFAPEPARQEQMSLIGEGE